MTQAALDLHILYDIAMDRGLDVLVDDLLNDPNQDVQAVGLGLQARQDVLEHDLAQLPAQLIATFAQNTSPTICALVEQARQYNAQSWLRPRHQCVFSRKPTQVWDNDDAHDAFIGSIVTLPDNERFVTASEDGTMKVWHVDGTCQRVLNDHDIAINSIKLSPDGTQLLAASDDETCSLRPVTTFERDVTMRDHTYYVSEAAMTSLGKVVSTCKDGNVRVFDAKTGACLHTLTGHNAWVYALAVSPDGKRAVTGSLNNMVNVWDVEAGSLVKCVLGEGAGDVMTVWGDLYIGRTNDSGIGHADSPSEMRWSADGERLISVAKDIIVWDARADAFVETMRMDGHAWKIQDMALFDSDSKLVTVAHCIKIWDMNTGEELKSLIGHGGTEIYSVGVTPDERYLITGDNNGVLKCWDLHAILNEDAPTGHMGRVYEPVLFDAARKTVVTSSSDQTAIVWDADTGLPTHKLRGHTNLFVYPRGFIKDDTQCITVSDGEMRIWDVATGEQVKCHKHTNNSLYGFGGMCLYNDGKHAICGAVCYPLTRWDLASGQFVELTGKTAFCDDFALTSDQKFVLSDAYFDKDDDDDDEEDNLLNQWDEWDEADEYTPRAPAREVLDPPGYEYTCPVQLWDIEGARLYQQFYPPNPTGDNSDKEYPVAVSWNADETLVIGAYSDGRLHVWQREDAEVVWSVEAHDSFIYAMHRKGDCVVTVAKDNDLMNIKGFALEDGQMLWHYTVPNDTFYDPHFSEDGRYAIGRTDDHTVTWIDLEDGRIMGSFTNPRELSNMAFDGQMIVLGDEEGFITCLDVVMP